MVTPLEVGRPRSINALENAMIKGKKLVMAAQREVANLEPQPEDIYPIGTLCEVKQLLKTPEGQIRILVEGLERVRITEFNDTDFYYEVSVVHEESTDNEVDLEMRALIRTVREKFEEYVLSSNKRIPKEILATILDIKDPDRLADTIAHQLVIPLEDKQRLLERLNVKKRFEDIYELISKEIQIIDLEKQIQKRVRAQMERNQKEFYLREQIKAIQKELGERDDKVTEVEEYKKKLSKLKLPKEVKAKVVHEIHRFEKMPPMAAETVVVRNYLDWMLSLPWSTRTKDRIDIDEAQRILDQDHYGLEQVKERILEFLAVRKLTKGMKGPILCLVGPPGVGKTSLARSVAEALNRKFVRLSLGGVRDEAEIRGHRRTYVGALPGKIIQAMKTAGSMNPVMLLDEIDKLAADHRGDPTSALLEVLDPEQNHTFGDHYLEVPFDLSEVMFITTGNVLHAIPGPLRDRMEVIQLPGYTEEEKIEIAKRHLWGKQLKNHGIKEEQLKISDNTFSRIVAEYTREAGVRNLERQLATICRKAAIDIVKGVKLPIRVSVNNLEKYLGIPKYRHSQAEKVDKVGVATGLAFTQFGGDILSIEITVVDGKGKLTLTGQLGEVMRESAQAAMSYIRSRSRELGIDSDFHETKDIHMHVPEGAIPKDGPSAGITIATALASALSGRPVRKEVAMTGEITLRGRVLPIGGVKEKILAAHRAGLTHIILPQENRKDLEDLPDNVRKKLRIDLVEHMDEVLDLALLEEAVDEAIGFIPTEQTEVSGSWLEDPQ